MTAGDVAAIEKAAYRAWPAAEVVEVQDWVFRAAGGFSRRNNSVQPGISAAGFDAKATRAGAFYAERQLPLIFRITPLCGAIDDMVDARGFSVEGSTDVMTAEVADRPPPSAGLHITKAPTEEWMACQAAWLGITETTPWRSILRRAADAGGAGFGVLHQGGRPVAAGLAVVHDEWMGLFEITVAPGSRRRGLGTDLSRVLLSWGKAAGGRRCFLQVEQRNMAARLLYESLGFAALYTYWYRRAPAPSQADSRSNRVSP